MSLSLLEVGDEGRALEAFLGVPEAVYQDDPDYNAPVREEVVADLRRPEFARAQRALVAMDGRRRLARLVARRSPALSDERGLPYGMLGFFEAVDGPRGREAVRRLFAEAISWLRETGAGEIIGPMDGDTWHKHRLNVGPFDDRPFLMEPYNPPWYQALWEEAGFRVLERYASTRVSTETVADLLEPKRVEAFAAGYRLRPLDLDRFDEELRLIYRLSRVIFAGNFLYTEIPEDEFLALYAAARRLLHPRLVWFARSPEGEDVGFLFAFPDRFRAVAAMRGRRGTLAKIRYLMRRNEVDAVNFKTIGVLPGHRRSGLAGALMCQGHREAVALGFRRGNHCLFREGNPSGVLDAGTGRLLRRYHLYRYEG